MQQRHQHQLMNMLQKNGGREHYNGWMILNFGYVINNIISSKFCEESAIIRVSEVKDTCRSRICRTSPAMDEHRSCRPALRHQKNSKNSENFTGYSTRADEQLSSRKFSDPSFQNMTYVLMHNTHGFGS